MQGGILKKPEYPTGYENAKVEWALRTILSPTRQYTGLTPEEGQPLHQSHQHSAACLQYHQHQLGCTRTVVACPQQPPPPCTSNCNQQQLALVVHMVRLVRHTVTSHLPPITSITCHNYYTQLLNTVTSHLPPITSITCHNYYTQLLFAIIILKILLLQTIDSTYRTNSTQLK